MQLHTSFSISALLFISLISTTPAQAATVTAATPAIAGSGCFAGSSAYQLKRIPNGFSLNIRSTQFRVNNSNVSCNIALPLNVPNGYRITNIEGTLSGYAKGKATLTRSYFDAGSTGQQLNTKFSSSRGQSFTKQDRSKLSTACGEDINVRMNSRLIASGAKSSASVSKISLTVRYAKCTR